MSDLLRKKTKPNKLLNRGQQITPNTTFTLDDVTSKSESKQPVTEAPAQKELETRTRTNKVQATTTTVRVSTPTKEKLNALVTMGIADSVDNLLEILIEEYESTYLTKEEKKQYSLILEIYAAKKKK
ncbi:hypothetical protein AWH48_16750 [Domibacillus aminovorans]|uniref:Uncharacterized protein n=1 Tax=Domibacillus aminovorans TaxID=29332 RepID=A0A177KZR1_9BACI|nr:DUF5388 domain-containing protein [Domibacillus aminovorans]OAH58646.1 hypothetical protein AWH48_16750 [Domibacillus aminovorans]